MDVFAGEVATFSCEVSCAGGPKAHWWLDGTLLQDGPQSTICECDGTFHSLTLSGLGVADSGTVTYRAGSLVSTAKLLVKGTSRWNPACTDASAPAVPACFLKAPGAGGWGLALPTCAMCGCSVRLPSCFLGEKEGLAQSMKLEANFMTTCSRGPECSCCLAATLWLHVSQAHTQRAAWR